MQYCVAKHLGLLLILWNWRGLLSAIRSIEKVIALGQTFSHVQTGMLWTPGNLSDALFRTLMDMAVFTQRMDVNSHLAKRSNLVTLFRTFRKVEVRRQLD